MPVNSFDHYPMSWKPDKGRLSSPLYLSLAKHLEDDIVCGILKPNTKLPPQRELADYLDINLSTVTRAFKLCELKGIIYANIGRGTFVSPSSHVSNTIIEQEPSHNTIEMGIINPYYEFNSIITTIARKVLAQPDSEQYFEYSYPLGTPSQKHAGLQWLSRFHIKADPENLAIVSGAQNALAISLLSLFKPGDKIVTDPFTYPHFKSLASLLRLQLVPVLTDDKGILPQALENLCKTTRMDGLYLMPSCSNPTNSAMDQDRRAAIAAIIQKYQLLLIEDDSYAFIANRNLLPLINYLPQQTVYISSISKSLCAGLRIAYLTYPDRFRESIENSIFALNIKTSSLNVEIASELIRSGAAENLLGRKLIIQEERSNIYKRYFPDDNPSNFLSLFRWLRLPKHWNGKLFELSAKGKGVHVYCSERFAIGNLVDYPAIRLALSSPVDSSELENGLSILRTLVDTSNHL